MFPGHVAHDATRGAVEQLTQVLSREAGPLGPRVDARSARVHTVVPERLPTGQNQQSATRSGCELAQLVLNNQGVTP